MAANDWFNKHTTWYRFLPCFVLFHYYEQCRRGADVIQKHWCYLHFMFLLLFCPSFSLGLRREVRVCGLKISSVLQGLTSFVFSFPFGSPHGRNGWEGSQSTLLYYSVMVYQYRSRYDIALWYRTAPCVSLYRSQFVSLRRPKVRAIFWYCFYTNI